MPLQATSGAASYDAFGGGVAAVPNYIEDVFSTYLYTGNGSTQTITNGIDLSTKGGMVWVKSRAGSVDDHILVDTARGTSSGLRSNTTTQATGSGGFTSFNTDGFSFGGSFAIRNDPSTTYVSWTFRKQPKFFDIVTYTGNGAMDRNIAHSLGSVPACIIIKRTDTTSNWVVWHGSNFSGGYATSQKFLYLNTTAASPQIANGYVSDSYNSSPSTQFMVLNSNGYGSSGSVTDVNASGGTYVAYLYAHNAGGFGLTGTDNVISCGSYTGNGSATGPVIDLGYEPQWLLIKNVSAIREWFLMDSMRGFTADGNNAMLFPNLSNAESNQTKIGATATGFQPRSVSGDVNASGNTYIYIAIRRGPMKVPTSGTSVFAPVATTANGATSITANFPVDLSMIKYRSGAYNWWWSDRLRGNQYAAYLGTSSFLFSNTTDVEQVYTDTTPGVMMASNTGIVDYAVLPSGYSGIYYNLRRAPSFFDEVCYTGTGTAGQTFNHNLGVAPELMITKKKSGTPSNNWGVYSAALGATKYLILDLANAAGTASTLWNNTAPTSSVFSLGSGAQNNSGSTYVAYLFATCPGVSKCTAFTGTGTLQTINCGFTSGSRFVLIKRTDAAGDWYVWDSSRGLSSSTDPYLLLNSTAAEVTSTNWVDTTATGFQVTAASGNNVNINGASYIALAIA